MKMFRYAEIGNNDEIVTVKISCSEIINDYYNYWIGNMRKTDRGRGMMEGKTDQELKNMCIEDFCMIHWCEEEPFTDN